MSHGRSFARGLAPALAVGIALAAASPAGAQGAEEETAGEPAEGSAALWIERMNEALLPASSMVAKARIHTEDGFGGESDLELEVVRKTLDGERRTLLTVLEPEVGRGTAYQIVARPGEPLERWVWLPEVRRLRQIVGIHRTDPFLGTEFTYEDLGLAAPVERGRGEVRWAEKDGERVVRVDSAAYHYYGSVVTEIDPETSLPIRVHFYDRAGRLFRRQTFEDVETFDGHPFPTVIEVRDTITGGWSRLFFSGVELGLEVPDRTFTESVIQRRLRERKKTDVPTPEVPPE